MEKQSVKILQILSNVFEVEISTLDENSSIDNIENWDSIRHLNLILALEEEFKISIPDEEVGNLVNFKLIELIINEQSK
jgi:acyl carrier protein